MFEEHVLFTILPFNIIGQDIDLGLPAVGDKSWKHVDYKAEINEVPIHTTHAT
jgi:hypothetical protein